MTFDNCIYYCYFKGHTKCKFWIRIISILYLPFFVIGTLYIILRWKSLFETDFWFWIVATIASIWFILGPVLVYRFMSIVINLKSDSSYSLAFREWFSSNESRYYRFYLRGMRIFSPTFIFIAIMPLIRNPEILTDVAKITFGIYDPFFWVILLYLCWFCIYYTNAVSVIFMMMIVVNDVIKDDIFNFNPTNVNHHKSVDTFRKLCNKIVSYACSGLLFIPLAFFFTRQAEHKFWFVGMLLFYGCSLLVAIIFPNLAIRNYTRTKSDEFILLQECLYFAKNIAMSKLTKIPKIREQMSVYNRYLFLQELKNVCQVKTALDIHVVITYLSAGFTIIVGITSLLADGMTVMTFLGK